MMSALISHPLFDGFQCVNARYVPFSSLPMQSFKVCFDFICEKYFFWRNLLQGQFPTQLFLVFVIILHYGELLNTRTIQIFSQGTQLSVSNHSSVLCHELALALLIKATALCWPHEACQPACRYAKTQQQSRSCHAG